MSKITIIDLASVKVKIVEIIESGFVQTSSHCQEQMGGRDFSIRDILKVLQTGEVNPEGRMAMVQKGSSESTDMTTRVSH